MLAEDIAAPIIVLHPVSAEGRQIAAWLRSAGLGRISIARTCDEAMFLLGRQNAMLLIIDEQVPVLAEQRLLRHIGDVCGHSPLPALVRLVDAGSAPDAARATAVEVVSKPLAAHDVVVRVGTALQRPDLLGRMDRERDQSAANLEVARRMQLGLLPTSEQIAALQEHCAGCLSAFYRPGDAVGGDFWGAWPTGEGRIALALVDFAGHGLSAALNTFRLHAILSEQGLPHGDAARMTGLLNQRLHDLLQRGQYATMIYAQIDPTAHRVEWCSAGGPSPLFVSATGSQDLEASGLPLGIKPDAAYGNRAATLPGAGVLCLFSDGLYESGPASRDIGRAQIVAALRVAAGLAAEGRLAEAARSAAAALEALRNRHPCPDHSDDVVAVCVAIGPDGDGDGPA
jgi:sigma-B regulation protein RsbU (phosphoserine phosphatase)